MSTPEQRFEVPPEYAEVYERAYRRAYEVGQGQLSGNQTPPPTPRRGSARGRRIAVPEQRTSRRGIPHQRSAPRVIPPLLSGPGGRRPRGGARAATRSERGPKRRATGSTILPLAGIAALGVLLLIGSFWLGRLSVGVNRGVPAAGTGPAATASATEGPRASSSPSPGPTSGTPADGESPSAPVSTGPYHGPVAPVRISSVRTTCHAKPGRSTSGQPVSYAVGNVLDKDPTTAWRCHGKAIGVRLDFTLPRETTIVGLGLIPGYAKTDHRVHADRYRQNNRITKVAWIFDNGTRLTQTMSGSASDRSLRVLRTSEIKTRTVTLEILGVTTGPRYNTMISTVRFIAAAPN